jgi:hypothetical protein
MALAQIGRRQPIWTANCAEAATIAGQIRNMPRAVLAWRLSNTMDVSFCIATQTCSKRPACSSAAGGSALRYFCLERRLSCGPWRQIQRRNPETSERLSGQRRSSRPITHETQPHETEQHHRPGRRFWGRRRKVPRSDVREALNVFTVVEGSSFQRARPADRIDMLTPIWISDCDRFVVGNSVHRMNRPHVAPTSASPPSSTPGVRR